MLLGFLQKYKKIIVASFAAIAVIALITIITLTTDSNINTQTKNTDKLAKEIVKNHNAPSTTNEKTISILPTKALTATPTNKVTPSPTSGTSAVQSRIGHLVSTPAPQINVSSPTPTAVASSPTPTPQPYPMFSGRNINTEGNTVTLPNMKVKITHEESGASQESTSSTFEFKSLTPGTYKVEAQSVEGYNIQHSVCFNCASDDHFYDASIFMVNVTSTHTSIGITLKYIAK